MTQVSRGNRPGVALPIRIHELLLSLAGRLDDDALADARQMLASAELDRSLEFVAGCLAAGGVVLTGQQHKELEELFANTYLDPSVIDRVVVRDNAAAYRHRFAVGPVDGREPDWGVADAVRPVLDALPDVRSVWCVWRLTPSGPVSGPVPHRLVLAGVGPGGYAPATAYRLEYALRRAGIRASVEVLVDGAQPTGYHQEAMRCARQVPFDDPGPGGGGGRPSMSPAEPVRAESFAAEPAKAGTPGAFAAEPATASPSAAPAVMSASGMSNAGGAGGTPEVVDSGHTASAAFGMSGAGGGPGAADSGLAASASSGVSGVGGPGMSGAGGGPAAADSRFGGSASGVSGAGGAPEVADSGPAASGMSNSGAAAPVAMPAVADSGPDASPMSAVADSSFAPSGMSAVADSAAPAPPATLSAVADSGSGVPATAISSVADSAPSVPAGPPVGPTAEPGLAASWVDGSGSAAPAPADSVPAAPAISVVADSGSDAPAPQAEVKPPSPFAVEPPRIDSVRSVPPTPPPPSERPSPPEPPARPQRVRPVESIKSVFAQEREVEEPKADPVQPASALSVENPTNSAPAPRRRASRARNEDEPPSRPRLVPAAPPSPTPAPSSGDKHSAALVDDILNTQERNLLRELQDELARREKQDSPGPWRSGRHGKPGTPFDQPAQAGPMAVNGVPPHPDSRGYGSA